jgi:hypothetical protein
LIPQLFNFALYTVIIFVYCNHIANCAVSNLVFIR